MADVLAFKPRPAPQETEPTAIGTAFCLGCDHVWQAQAPLGTDQLECPQCHRHMGMFKFEFQPPAGTLVYTCNCGNQLFTIMTEGHMCPRCGVMNRY